jgi:hypothetical protein
MILKLAPQASFINPSLSLIKSILVLLATPIYHSQTVTFFQVELACSSSSSRCAVPLAWAKGPTALLYNTLLLG